MKKRSVFENSLNPKATAPNEKYVSLPIYLTLMLIIALAAAIAVLLVLHYLMATTPNYRELARSSFYLLASCWQNTITLNEWGVWLALLSDESLTTSYSFLAISLIFWLISIAKIGQWLFKKMTIDGLLHIRGPLLVEGKPAVEALKKTFKPEYRFSGNGLTIFPNLILPKQRENQNMLILGAVGSGKTQFLLPLIEQVVDSPNKKSIIFDFKGDFTEYFLNDSSVKLIAPWDTRGLTWDIRADIKTVEEAQLFAEALIPEAQGNSDPMWVNGSRTILAGCVFAAIRTKPNTWDWQSLAELIQSDPDTLHKVLQKYYPQAASLVDKSSKTSMSFIMTLQSYCQPIFNFAAFSTKTAVRFSVKDWVKNDQSEIRHLIVQYSTQYAPLGKASVELTLYFVTRYLLSLPDNPQRELYFFLDECAHLNFKKLPELLSTGRSKGAKVFVGVQDLGLLTTRFSENEVNAMASMIGTLVVFRMASLGGSASKVAEGLGKRLVERRDISLNSEESRQASWAQVELPVVCESDITGLPQAGKNGATGYLAIAGTDIVARLCWPLTKLPKIAPAIELKVVEEELATNLQATADTESTQHRKHRLKQAVEEIDSALGGAGNA